MKERLTSYRLAVLAAIATLAVYLPVLQNDFISWDDELYVVTNQRIRTLDWEFIRWAFSDSSLNYWHPLAWLSHAVDYALWGLNPSGHHFTSILLHAVNTLIVTVLVIRLLEQAAGTQGIPTPERAGTNGNRPFLSRRAVFIAGGMTGLLFGIHPLRVESVAWVSERKDLLYSLFYLLGVMAYASYAASIAAADRPGSSGFRRRPAARAGYYLLTVLLMLFALASKPMAVTFPAVLLILDWYPFGRVKSLRSFTRAAAEKIPLFVLGIAVAAVTFYAQRENGAMLTLDEVPLSSRVGMAASAMMTYLVKMLLPLRLLPVYPYPENVPLVSFQLMSPALLVIAITAVCFILAKRRKVFPAVWLYYGISLLPVLGLIRVGIVAQADRFTYLPGIGPFLLVGLAAAWIERKTAYQPGWGRRAGRSMMIIALALMFCLSWLTVRQIGYWKNNTVFWDYLIEQEPRRLPFIYSNRGLMLARIGELDRAMEDLSSSILLQPNNPEAYMNRGIVLGQTGRFQEAIEDFSAAIHLKPSGYLAYINRAEAYRSIGRTEPAISDYTQALALNPGFSQAYFFRGELYRDAGRYDAAGNDFQKACDLGSEEGCEELRGRATASPLP